MRQSYQSKLTDIQWAAFRDTGPFQQSKGNTPSQKRGLAYERKVQRFLVTRFELRYFPAPWIQYGAGGRGGWAQPDGLLLLEDPARVVICEIKLSHTAQSYYQVENLYRPLVEHLFRRSPRRVCSVEITRWYDCAIAFPVKPRVERSILAATPGAFVVHTFFDRD